MQVNDENLGNNENLSNNENLGNNNLFIKIYDGK